MTRRTVAKYREDMRIPSTHQRRVRKVRRRGVRMKVSYTGIKQRSSRQAARETRREVREVVEAGGRARRKRSARGGDQRARICTRRRSRCSVHDHQLVGIGSDSDVFTRHDAPRSTSIEKQAAKAARASGATRTRRSEPIRSGRERQAERSRVAQARKQTSARRASCRGSDQRVFRVESSRAPKPITLEEAMLEMEDGRDYVAYRDADKQVVSHPDPAARRPLDLIET